MERGGLIWSDEAWKQLLGCTAEEFGAYDVQNLRTIEQRMLYLRLTLLIGWSAEVEKLAVCRIFG